MCHLPVHQVGGAAVGNRDDTCNAQSSVADMRMFQVKNVQLMLIIYTFCLKIWLIFVLVLVNDYCHVTWLSPVSCCCKIGHMTKLSSVSCFL